MADEELKSLLQKNLEASQESLRILKKINRGRLVGNFFSFIKWVIIIGAAVGSFYYLEPYIGQIKEMYKQVQGLQQNMPNIKLPK